MSVIRTILSKYFEILEENSPARYQNCKYVPVEFDVSASLDDLWEKHDDALKNMKLSDVQPEKSLLDLKIEIASRIFQNCCFCERRCGIDRNRQSGNCGVKQSLIASEFLHFGEESVLVPSHTIFFSGCTFHCVFCQNWDISQQNIGFYIDPSNLCNIINERHAHGSKNVNWVGGDPTPNLLYILKTLKFLDVNIPQIWNSNMYCSVETMKLLDGVVDLYLTDFKYGTDKCAKVFSRIDNYVDIVERNHRLAYDSGELIIRHLVMPNHIDCCSKPVMDWISENLSDVIVNIMGQYRPEYHAHKYKDISRKIYIDEVLEVKEYAEKLGIHQI